MAFKAALTAMLLVMFGVIWAWQHSKFVDKHGFFYSLSPSYGSYILAFLLFVLFVYVLRVVLIEAGDKPNRSSGD